MARSLIRLTSSHFFIVLAGLVTVLAVGWIVVMPAWEDLYAREFGLPRLEKQYRFRWGTVTITRDGVVEELEGIVSVSPGGDFAKMGVRQHDLPFAHHGYGAAWMYSALMAGEGGHHAEFEVINADDWAGGDPRPRTIRVPPRNAPK